jgi:hypothetical protein
MPIPVWMRRYFNGREINSELVGWTLGKKHRYQTSLMDIKEKGWTSDMSMKEQLLARLKIGEPYRAVYNST